MKNFILICLVIFGGYKLYQHKVGNHHVRLAPDGRPIAEFFVSSGCGDICEGVASVLKDRKIPHEVIDIQSEAGEKSGVLQYPLVRVGKKSVWGDKRNEVVGMLAEVYGDSALYPAERTVMKSHFDHAGKPRVVLYGTSWCPYCKKQHEYFRERNIRYEYVDVESSDSARQSYEILHGSGYPLIYVGYRAFSGYTERPIQDALAEWK